MKLLKKDHSFSEKWKLCFTKKNYVGIYYIRLIYIDFFEQLNLNCCVALLNKLTWGLYWDVCLIKVGPIYFPLNYPG